VAVSAEGGREGLSGFNERLCRVVSLVQRMMDDAHHLAVLTTDSKSFRRVDRGLRLRLRSILSERVSDLFRLHGYKPSWAFSRESEEYGDYNIIYVYRGEKYYVYEERWVSHPVTEEDVEELGRLGLRRDIEGNALEKSYRYLRGGDSSRPSPPPRRGSGDQQYRYCRG
jgi:hypothetical protein